MESNPQTHTSISHIQKTVMRRAYIIRGSRAVLSLEAGALVLAGLALYGIGREVWVARVFANAPALTFENLPSLSHFWTLAFLHTHLPVQILSLIVFISLVYLARETARLLVLSTERFV